MKIVKGRFSKKYWIANSKGKRITKKVSDSIDDYSYNGFIIFQSFGNTWICDKKAERLILHKRSRLWHKYIYNKYHVFYGYYSGYQQIFDSNFTPINIDATLCISEYKYGLIPAITQDNLYGYMDENLEWKIKPRYSSANGFNEYGYAVVVKDSKQIIIDTNGCELLTIDSNFSIKFLSSTLFIVDNDYIKGVMDITGKEVIPMFYDNITLLNNNFLKLIKNKKLGLADLQGNIILEPVYDEIMETPDKFVVRDFAKKEVLKEISVNK